MFAAERGPRRRHHRPVLAKGKTRTGRLLDLFARRPSVRRQRRRPPAAVLLLGDRAGVHPAGSISPGYDGILQADAYSGFNAALTASDRKGGPITGSRPAGRMRGASCLSSPTSTRGAFQGRRQAGWPRSRRSLSRTVQKFDAIFALERSDQRLVAAGRVAARRTQSVPLVNDLHRMDEAGSGPSCRTTTTWPRL